MIKLLAHCWYSYTCTWAYPYHEQVQLRHLLRLLLFLHHEQHERLNIVNFFAENVPQALAESSFSITNWLKNLPTTTMKSYISSLKQEQIDYTGRKIFASVSIWLIFIYMFVALNRNLALFCSIPSPFRNDAFVDYFCLLGIFCRFGIVDLLRRIVIGNNGRLIM